MILLDSSDKRPIYEQITDKLSELMLKGVLAENDPLPSVRNFAAELSINPNTVQRAYNELDKLGFTYTVKGKGNFVAGIANIRKQKIKQLLEEFTENVNSLKAADVDKNDIISQINEIYDNKNTKGGDSL